MKRERHNQELSFFSSPALRDSTWEHGFMDIVAHYDGEPFAFMVVTNGTFDAEAVYRDAQCTLYQKLGSYSRELVLYETQREAIIKGCTALILHECPSVLCKQKCPPVKTLLQG